MRTSECGVLHVDGGGQAIGDNGERQASQADRRQKNFD
jgi:hypothetical protein